LRQPGMGWGADFGKAAASHAWKGQNGFDSGMGCGMLDFCLI
jgi:hypothetical protein